MIKMLYSNCLLSAVTSEFMFVFSHFFFELINFYFISELIEENEENEELSEVEGINHFRTGKKPLSCSQTQKVLKKRRAKKYFTCTQCGKRLTKQT